MKLPSKKVLSVFVVIAALVVAIIITFGKDTASTAINYAGDLMTGQKISLPENPSWQSEFEKINSNIDKTQLASSTNFENLTDAVSVSLTANYLSLKQSGQLNSDSAQTLVNQTLSYIETNTTNTKTASNLNVIPDNGKISITEYGENLGQIAKIKSPADIVEEVGLVVKVAKSTNPSDIAKLDGVIAGYEEIIGELIKMPVPQTFVKAHLGITNAAIGITESLKQIKKVSEDPISGLVALQAYQKNIATLSQAVQATISFITKSGVTYKQGSNGYYLLYGI